MTKRVKWKRTPVGDYECWVDGVLRETIICDKPPNNSHIAIWSLKSDPHNHDITLRDMKAVVLRLLGLESKRD